jgi:hypothetical protein
MDQGSRCRSIARRFPLERGERVEDIGQSGRQGSAGGREEHVQGTAAEGNCQACIDEYTGEHAYEAHGGRWAPQDEYLTFCDAL